MAQTKRSAIDNQAFSYGEQGQALATATTQRTGVVVCGALTDDTNIFQRLPIGTSANGTAVLVDLIGTEPVVVQVGTITAGTINKGTINAGTINTGTINAGTVNTGTINTGTINTG